MNAFPREHHVRASWPRIIVVVLAAVAMGGSTGCLSVIAGLVAGVADATKTTETNTVPTVTVAPVARATNLVRIPITIVDDDASVTLSATYDLGDGSGPRAADISPTSASISGGSATLDLDWQAATDIGGSSYRTGLTVTVTVTDGKGQSRSATSGAFTFGNDAPAISDVTVQSASGKISGIAVVDFTVSDSSGDAVSLDSFEFSANGSFTDTVNVPITTGTGGNFPVGGIAALPTTAGGTTHSFAWDSEVSADLDSMASKIRITVRDDFGVSNQLETAVTFAVDNATSPPAITLTAVPASPMSGNATFEFTIADADGDACLVVAQYSLDSGANWLPASTSSQTNNLLPGTNIPFVWQTTQLGLALTQNVLMRFSVSDAIHFGNTETTAAFDVDNTPPPGNNLPSVVIGAIARTKGTVNIPVTVSDADATAGNDVTVTLAVEVDFGGGFVPATLISGGTIVVSNGQTVGSVVWDAPTQVSSTAFASGFSVRITPHDGTDAGGQATSAPFDFGNDAPVVTTVSVQTVGGEISGIAVVDLTVQDTSDDAVSLQSFEFSADGTFTDTVNVPITVGFGGHFPVGGVNGLATTAAGAAHSIAWDSAVIAPIDTTASKIRLTVTDAFDGSNQIECAATFAVDNTTSPPVITLTLVPGSPMSGLAQFEFTITDADNDACLVVGEFSLDGGASWQPASTPSPTNNLSPGTGIPFVWQTTQLGAVFTANVQMRFSISDANDTGNTATTAAFDVDNTTNNIPSIAFGSISRTAGTVNIPVTVTDADDDTVTLTVEVDFGGGFVPATGIGGNVVAVSGGQTQATVTWDAPTQVGNTNFAAGFQVRVAPHDGIDPGPVQTSSPFEFGNDAPSITHVEIVDNDADGKVSGDVTIRYRVADGQSDTIVVVEADYSTDGGTTWLQIPTADIIPGSALPSGIGSPDAFVAQNTDRLITWNTLGTFGIVNIADLDVRIRATDAIGGTELGKTSPYVDTTTGPAIALENQTAPFVDGVDEAFPIAARSGRLAIAYTLIDDEGDPVDVRIEYSGDGSVWSPCTEFPDPRSEGVYELATAPDTAAGDGGVTHVFVWNTAADLLVETSVSVRITAVQADGLQSPPTVLFTQTIGAPNDTPLFDDRFIDHSPNWYEHMNVADFNNDGKLDLALARRGSPGALRIHLGNGDGTFQAATDYQTVNGRVTYEIAIADLDGDLDLDVLVGVGTETTNTFLNNGDGTFAAGFVGFNFPGFGAFSVDLGKVDGDTFPDLVFVDASYRIRFTHGVGDGTFTGNDLLSTTADIVQVQFVDVNGDGELDIVASRNSAVDSDSDLLVMIGNGDGTFQAEVAYFTNSRGGAFEIGDFNGDGFPDVAVLGIDDSSTNVFLNNSDGTFATVATYLGSSTSRELTIIDLADDGVQDIAAPLDSGFGLDVLLGQRSPQGVGNGTFRSAANITSVAFSECRAAESGDFDGDGFEDLVVLDRVFGTHVLLFRPKTQFTTASFEHTSYSSAFAVRQVDIGDLDADGRTDLIVSDNGQGSTFRIRRGSGFVGIGTGEFDPLEVASMGQQVNKRDVELIDLNNNGALDYFIISRKSGQGKYHYMQGILDNGVPTSEFTTIPFVDVDGSPFNEVTAFTFGDFDGDGWKDMAVLSAKDIHKLRVILNDGSGTPDYANITTYTSVTGSDPSANDGVILNADVNGDGNLDLLVGVANKLDVFLGDGNGAFGSPPSVTLTTAIITKIEYLITGDFNGDGILDLILATLQSGDVEMFYGNGANGVGNGTFTTGPTFNTAGTCNGLGTADFNDDGVLDLVYADGTTNMLSIMLGNSVMGVADGTFDIAGAVTFATSTLANTNGPSNLTIGDFNHDGLPDIALAAQTANKFDLFISRSTALLSDANVPLSVFVEAAGASTGNIVGATTVPTDLLTNAYGGRDVRIAKWRFYTDGVGGPPEDLHDQGARRSDFRDLLRTAGVEGRVTDWFGAPVAVPQNLRHVTEAWTFAGDMRLAHVADPAHNGVANTGTRGKFENRFGARANPGSRTDFQRAGLDLSDPTFANQRGVIIDLPIIPGRAGDIPGAAAVRIFQRQRDWRRCPAVTGDPMSISPDPAAPEAPIADYLPRGLVDALDPMQGYRDVYRGQFIWREIPEDADGDFRTGTGPRFIVDQANGRIRVLTDKLGTFQAYIQN